MRWAALIMFALMLGAENIAFADCTPANNLVAPHQRATWVEGGLVYDTTADTLKTCDGTNYTEISGGGGSVSFPLAASPLGTSSAPAYSFSGDTNTGLYSSSADTLSFSVGGATGFLVSGTASAANHLVVMPGTSSLGPTISNSGTTTGGAQALGINIVGRDATASNSRGGEISITAGKSNYSWDYVGGSNITLTGGAVNKNGVTQSGGGVYLYGGPGQGNGNAGGDVAISGGSGVNTSGGNVYLLGGTGSGSMKGIVSLQGRFNGIGTSNPTTMLDVVSNTTGVAILRVSNGTSTCTLTPTAGGNWSCSSDARLKTDIEDSKVDALDWASSFRVRDYMLRENGVKASGVIAQELHRSHPEMVHKGTDGLLTVDQPNPWLMIKAIQELRLANEALAALVKKQSQEIQELNVLWRAR